MATTNSSVLPLEDCSTHPLRSGSSSDRGNGTNKSDHQSGDGIGHGDIYHPVFAMDVGDMQNIDHHVDVLQTYNTALCYLCSINADVTEIERYLFQHPQSLLMENLCLLSEDSATYILQQHAKVCHCQSLHCHLNRIRVMDLIERGYVHFRQLQTSTKESSVAVGTRSTSNNNTLSLIVTNIDENTYFAMLVQIEHNIRQWRIQELTMRNTMIELSITIRTHHIEIKRYRKQLERHSIATNAIPKQQQNTQYPSAISLLACTVGRHVKHDDHDDIDNRRYNYRNEQKSARNSSVIVPELPSRSDISSAQQYMKIQDDRISVLQGHIRDSTQQLQSVQEQHYQLIQSIRNGRREQFNIFKNHIFQNCVRHNICSMIPPRIPPENATTVGPSSIKKDNAISQDPLLHEQQPKAPPSSMESFTMATNRRTGANMPPPMDEVTVDISFDNATAYSI